MVKPRLLILPFLFFFAIGLAGQQGCATAGSRHVATVTAASAHAVLSATQDTEMLIACGKPTAPAPPACVAADDHKQLHAKLTTAFDLDAQLARAIRDWPATSAPPATIGELLGQITTILNYVLERLPPGAAKTKLLTQIGGTQ